MRRSVVSSFFLFFLSVLLLALGLAGCGGNGGSGGTGPAAKVIIAPTALSLNRGEVTGVAAAVQDANGNTVFDQTITFSSSNTKVVTLSSGGAVCAGQWDSSFVHCTPFDAASTPPRGIGTSTITATASPSNLSASLTAFVHEQANSIVVGPVGSPLACGSPPPAPAGCVSMGAIAPDNTLNYTAIACSADATVCAAQNPPATPPCQLPTSSLGAFTFGSANQAVVTVAADTTNPDTVAVATAKGPGRARVTATLSGTASLSEDFITCPPASIFAHVKDQPTQTTVSVAKGSSTTLAADAVDTNNVTMTGLVVAWTSSSNAVANIGSNGASNAVDVGTANMVASCAPPACNAGTTEAIYSNPVAVSVTGTASSTTVWVTSSDAGTSTLIPIDTSTNTTGTAVSLPSGFTAPNSLVFASNGLKAFLGTDAGLLVFDPTARTFTQQTTAKGKVLAVSPNGVTVVVADTTPGVNNVYLYTVATNSVVTFNIAGAIAADFTPDGSRLFLVASDPTFGDRVYEIASDVFANTPASGPPTDVALLPNGSFAYVADPNGEIYSACTNVLEGSLGITPILIKGAAKPVDAPNNTQMQMIAVVGSAVQQIDVLPVLPSPPIASGDPCPLLPAHNISTPYSFPGVASFTPVQMFVTSDSSKAIITTSDTDQLLVYTVGTDAALGTASTIALQGSPTGSYTGGVTLDGTKVYVGVSGINEVQGYLLSDGSLIQRIPVSLVPKLVAVQPK